MTAIGWVIVTPKGHHKRNTLRETLYDAWMALLSDVAFLDEREAVAAGYRAVRVYVKGSK